MKLNILYDILLRSLTILVRALFTFYLVKILSIEDFGMYSYLLASIAFFMYLAGADFYAYAHREMLSGRCTLESAVKSQGIFLSHSILLTAGLSVAISWNSLSPLYIILLPLLLAGEAISAESVRLLIACGKPSAANIVNFLKSAGWMLPLWLWGYLQHHLSIDILLLAWASGLATATISGFLFTPVKWAHVISTQVPDGFFRQAWCILPKILLGTLALRALFSLDRLFVSYGFDAAMLGTYGFFVAVASAYLAVMDAGILARLFPPLVAASVSNYSRAKQYKRKMEVAAVFGGLVAYIGYELLIDIVIIFVGKSHFMEHKQLGSLLIISYAIYAASMGSHYILYGRHKDNQIMTIHLLSLLPFSAMIGLAIHRSNPELIAWGVLFSICFQYFIKAYLVRQNEST